MPISTPSNGWLEVHLLHGNSGKSVAGLWHSSSVCAVYRIGHNSNTSQAGFDGGEYYFGGVELSARPEERETRVLSLSLDPRGMEVYILDEATSDDNKELSPSDSELLEG